MTKQRIYLALATLALSGAILWMARNSFVDIFWSNFLVNLAAGVLTLGATVTAIDYVLNKEKISSVKTSRTLAYKNLDFTMVSVDMNLAALYGYNKESIFIDKNVSSENILRIIKEGTETYLKQLLDAGDSKQIVRKEIPEAVKNIKNCISNIDEYVNKYSIALTTEEISNFLVYSSDLTSLVNGFDWRKDNDNKKDSMIDMKARVIAFHKQSRKLFAEHYKIKDLSI